MANKLIELNQEGLRISTKEEIKTYLKEIISNAYGTDINFNPNYPEGIFIDALATPIRDSMEAIQGLYNSFNIRNSSGAMLDSLSNLINMHRKRKTQAYGTVQIKLKKGTYSWSLLNLRDQNNNLWRNINKFDKEVTIEEESVEMIVICDRFGEVEQPTSFTIMSPIQTTGMTVAQNLTDYIQGTSDEDDISLRNRVTSTPIYNSSKILEQLEKFLLENKYVKSVKIYSNDLDGIAFLKLKNSTGAGEVELPPTQLAVIVQHSEENPPNNENKKEILRIIANYKGLSTISFNPEGQVPAENIQSLQYDDLQNPDIAHKVYYIVAQRKTGVVINVDISEGVNYNSVTTIPYVKSLVASYLKSLGVGINIGIGGLTSYLYENADKQFTINSVVVPNDKAINYDEFFSSTEGDELTVNVTKEG